MWHRAKLSRFHLFHPVQVIRAGEKSSVQFKQQIKHFIREQISVFIKKKTPNHIAVSLKVSITKARTLHWNIFTALLKSRPIRNSKTTEHHICPNHKLMSGSTRKAWWHSCSPSCPQAARCANIRLSSNTIHILRRSSNWREKFFARVKK